MKLQIISDRTFVVDNGYIGVHFSDINEIQKSTIDMIKCVNSLYYVENPYILVQHLASKLRYGGVLHIVDNDAFCLFESCVSNKKNLEKIFENGRKSISDLELISKMLQGVGLEILQSFVDYNTGKFTIIGKKPHAE